VRRGESLRIYRPRQPIEPLGSRTSVVVAMHVHASAAEIEAGQPESYVGWMDAALAESNRQNTDRCIRRWPSRRPMSLERHLAPKSVV